MFTRRTFCAGVLGALACARDPAAKLTIALLPLLPAPDEAMLAAVDALARDLLGAAVLRLAPEPLPATAWYAPKRRHRAEGIVRVFESRVPSSAARILGVTARDISTSHGEVTDQGVLGLGTMGGRAAVASSHGIARSANDDSHARTLFVRVRPRDRSRPRQPALRGARLPDAGHARPGRPARRVRRLLRRDARSSRAGRRARAIAWASWPTARFS